MRIVAGCDGGGSKCTVHVAVLDQGKIVATGAANAGPANVASDRDQALSSMQAATELARQQAGIDADTQIDLMVAAVAGASRCDATELANQISSVVNAGRTSVVADVSVLFAAAKITGPAVATIVGTGSIAWFRRADGSVRRAGGLGPFAGDAGSGYWIGRQAIAGNVLPDLSDQLQHEKLSAAAGGADSFDSAHVTRIASHAARVFELADRDPQAKQIVEQAADEITKLLIDAVSESPHVTTSTDSQPLAWVCGGGVAVNQVAWLAEIRSRCAERGLLLANPVLIVEPVDGALQIAIDDIR